VNTFNKLLTRVLFFIFLLFPASGAWASGLARTGQDLCYDVSGTEISCATSGQTQDGALKAGAAWPGPRFVDNGDGTITDNLTGLMWLKDANCVKSHYQNVDTHGLLTWEQALNFIAGINNGTYSGCQAGHTDWRMPNILELSSLHNPGFDEDMCNERGKVWHCRYLALWLASQGFINVRPFLYWSSTTDRGNIDEMKYSISMMSGVMATIDPGNRLYLWPVRDAGGASTVKIRRTGQTTSYGPGDDGALQKGEPWPDPRFTDNGDGTVTDNLTGLMWLKDANCIHSHYQNYDDDGNVNWQQALDFVDGINNGSYPLCAAGRNDWRLPNKDELFSLVDFSRDSPPHLPPGHPFENVLTSGGRAQDFWTSTTYALGRSYSWMLSDHFMTQSSLPKSNSSRGCVWPVRNAQ